VVRGAMTPRLVLDKEKLERNIARAAERFRTLGLSFRPHLKTHKSAEIMRRQIDAGASGVTVATLHEAEAAIDGGARDVLVAFPPVGRWRLEQLAAIAARARVIVACTDGEQVRALAEHGGVRKPFEYYWEVDSGARRLGTRPGQETAAKLAPLAGIAGARLIGLMTFPGHAYRAPDAARRREIAAAEATALSETRDALAQAGIDAGILSGGSTPTAYLDEGKAALDEYRCGNYVFFDATQVALGVASSDECALTVEATVLSRPEPDRLILDSGSKALAAERMSDLTPTFGIVSGYPEVALEALYEEHGICRVDGDTALVAGDRVTVIPNHACTCANLHDAYVVQARGQKVARWPLDARGWRLAAA
jgi:D-serine deaminase-like pyridoxal phosphate-dependent protein